MKKLFFLLLAPVSVFTILSLTSFTNAGNRPSANGQGSLTLPGDVSRRFAFHANTMPNGSVQGNGEVTYTGGELKVRFSIDCMTVSGNSAHLSGTVLSDDQNPERVGWKCHFRVVDNGEGNNSAPDQISLVFTGPAYPPCTVAVPLPLIDIEGGNIQVKN